MSLLVKVGSFISTGGINRTQAVTGVGFQGKFLLTLSGVIATPDLNTLQFMQGHNVGVARGTGADGSLQVAHGLSAAWNGLLSRTQGAADADITLAIHETFNLGNGAQGSVVTDGFMSFDPDGFTLFGTAFAATVHHYLMLGGDDLVTEPFQHPSWPHTPGVQTITGASQRPTLALFFVTTFAEPGGITWAMGWYDGTRQGVSALQEKMFANPSVDQQYQSPAHCLALQDPVTGVLTGRAACTGFTEDGLTLEWDIAPVASGVYTVVLLSGVTAACGAFTQATASGPQIVPVPVAPQAIVLLSGNHAPAASVVDDVVLSMGLSDSVGQHGTWHGETTNTISTNLRWMSSTTALTLAHPTTPGVGVIDAQATVSAFDPAGAFTMDWSAVDGTPREILYLVLGPAVSPPPPHGGPPPGCVVGFPVGEIPTL